MNVIRGILVILAYHCIANLIRARSNEPNEPSDRLIISLAVKLAQLWLAHVDKDCGEPYLCIASFPFLRCN